MPEWLQHAVAMPDLVLPVVAVRLAVALVAGLIVAGIARLGRRDAAADTFPVTLVLLCVLIALVTQVIGDSQARAFSLVGALAIVRFRTIVRDTQDTAFVMFSVVVGMGVGAGFVLATCIGMAVITVGVVIARFTPLLTLPPVIESQIAIRAGVANHPEQLLSDVFATHLERHALVSAETGRQGTVLDLTYRIRLKPGIDPVALLTQLNKLPGLESVEWHERAGE